MSVFHMTTAHVAASQCGAWVTAASAPFLFFLSSCLVATGTWCLGGQMAAYTAASKFVIGALRDDHAKHAICNNNSAVAAAAQEMSRGAVAILSDEAPEITSLPER